MEVTADIPVSMVVLLAIGFLIVMVVITIGVGGGGGEKVEEKIEIFENAGAVSNSLNVLMQITTEDDQKMGDVIKKLLKEDDSDNEENVKEEIQKNLDGLHDNYKFYIIYEGRQYLTIGINPEDARKATYTEHTMFIEDGKTAQTTLITWTY
jgi:hypothetical protein